MSGHRNMPDTKAPQDTFAAFGRLLAPLVAQPSPDVEALFQDWLDLATHADALVAADGRSHVPTLIRADVRLARTGDTSGTPGVAALIAASRAAGWQGRDMSEVLAAALECRNLTLLERILALPGLPPRDTWCAIRVPPLKASGTPDPHAKPLPPPSAWASVDEDHTGPLQWWLSKGLPLPPRVLDHATPATLDMLVHAGATPDDRTAAAWRRRCVPRGTQLLADSEVNAMLARLEQGQALPAAALAERQRAPGHALLAELGSARMASAALDRALQAWHAALPGGGLPGFPPGRTWLFRKMKGVVPWWSHALAGCVNRNGQGRNLVALFDNWEQAAGRAPGFDPGLPPESRDLLVGMALLGACLTANALSPGTIGNELSNNAAPPECLAAHRLFLTTGAWADLDERAAWSCLCRVMRASYALGGGLSDTASARLSMATTTILQALAMRGPAAAGGAALDVAMEMVASIPSWAMPYRAFAPIRDLLSATEPASPRALHLGFTALAKTAPSDLDVAWTNAAAPSPPAPAVATPKREIVQMLSQRIASGACLDPELLPELSAAPPIVQSLAQQNAMAFASRRQSASPRTRRLA